MLTSFVSNLASLCELSYFTDLENILSYLYIIYIYIYNVYGCCVCMHNCTPSVICIQHSQRLEKNVRSHCSGIPGSYEMRCEPWELNTSPLDEHPVFLPSEPLFQFSIFIFQISSSFLLIHSPVIKQIIIMCLLFTYKRIMVLKIC